MPVLPRVACLLLVLVPTLQIIPASAQQAAPPDEKRTVPIVNGMTIDIDNSIANVDARVKSLGPGACGTTISVGAQTTGYVAPPLVWSDWFVVYTHFNGHQVKVSMDITCDTGAIGEIRYFAAE